MRSFLLLIGCLLAGAIALAQGRQGTARVFVYSDFSLGIGDPMAFRAMADCLFLKHHEIGIGYNAYWHRGPDVPASAANNQSFFALTAYPQETLSGLALTYAYVLYPKKHANELRYLLRVGAVLGRRVNPYNFKDTVVWGRPPTTHRSNDVSKVATAAFIFQPTMAFTPCKGFGLSIGAYFLISEYMNGAGITIGMQPGKVGNHHRYHSPDVLAASRARHLKKMFWKKKKNRYPQP